MSTAGQPADRLRQIAILVSIVDSAAAQKLLSHLSPAIARRVIELARNLGPVSAEEQHQILTAFQQSASFATTQLEQPNETAQFENPKARPHADSAWGSITAGGSTRDEHADSLAANPTWTTLDKDVLLRFLVAERPNVIAVVISQLDTQVSVAILQDLGSELSCEVLKCLSMLGNIDPMALAAIEEHIAERIGQQHDQIKGESENARRIEALLMAAPTQLRSQWQLAMGREIQTPNDASNKVAPNTSAVQVSGDPTTKTESPSVIDMVEGSPSSSLPELDSIAASHVAEKALPQSGELGGLNVTPQDTEQPPDVLPLTQPNTQPEPSNQSLIRLEFDRLLHLPSGILAQVLSSADSQDVLIAIAGSTPAFIQSLYRMLDRRDRQALEQRLQQVSTASAAEIRHAQQRVIKVANKLLRQSHDASSGIRRAA